ncbi:hypothetical protein HUT16_27475 [Kitasatospora sp. NA04385]|uniref:hypothetical protein n=1 Tax=Kitasatospora sp. NA04385 TaxID=2742135 RepID=UPI001592232A|nr:hypothetical protein [Kitasatospora sp. NA04385]QKW22321.1 hypothetical protein HUT16_27475 [Kitasatospora sp. NA04385]
MPVDHKAILEALQPLAGGLVAGECQTRRDGALIITAELLAADWVPQEDEWEGVFVRVISTTAGPLAVNAFRFGDYGTLPLKGGTGRVSVGTRPEDLQGEELAAAIEEYVALFR